LRTLKSRGKAVETPWIFELDNGIELKLGMKVVLDK